MFRMVYVRRWPIKWLARLIWWTCAALCCGSFGLLPAAAADNQQQSPVRVWEGTLTVPTYPWEEDINPKFWALETGAKLSTTVRGAIVYPYVMQDHLLRGKPIDRQYKALFLENEYLRVVCLPELGGRLHSVLDKTRNQEMFHLNRVIKPGMIAMRGAWISGGVEWNSGPHGHTVTVLSPVNALTGRNPDGSCYLEISNCEQIFRTRWTVRVTLHPGRKYLDERISLYNPTDGTHPYYFWNCTAFPNRPGTRFIFPMSLGTDHFGREFFRWPIHEGRDLSWLKNYETYASVFAVQCTHDFFGAYDVDADRGVVQWADHRSLPGKKAWTWGEWDFGKVAQQNLTDEDGPYIEVQSGPLPTQSDYGMLGPRRCVAWQEWWYPVHGLGDGFEYATRDVALNVLRRADRLEVRLLATAVFPDALCTLSRKGQVLLRKQLNLTPDTPAVIALAENPALPVEISVAAKDGGILASYTSPLEIAKVEPPDPAGFLEKPDEQQTADELCAKARKFDLATDRLAARRYYLKALSRDPKHVPALHGLAVLDFEAGLYASAAERLVQATSLDASAGLSWFYLGACHFRLGQFDEALRCAVRAAHCPDTTLLGHDLAGRAAMRLGNKELAIESFRKAVAANPTDPVALDRLAIAHWAAGNKDEAWRIARQQLAERPTALAPRAVLALHDPSAMAQFAEQARGFLGDVDFEVLEASLMFAEMGLWEEAARIAEAVCVQGVPKQRLGFMPLYHLAWYAAQRGDQAAARRWLQMAAATTQPRRFASRAEEVEILRYAAATNPADAQAHLQLGCLLAALGRVDEAAACWQEAARLAPGLSIAWRNLGLVAAARNDLAAAEKFYRKAIEAKGDDQTLYRDLAEILIAAGRRAEAIQQMTDMPLSCPRRAEITIMLAQALLDEQRYEDCIHLLTSTPYFVNWEGQDITWRLFNRAHIQRGRQLLQSGDARSALRHFEAALTYPANLNVGRSNKPVEAPAQYWRGKALAALGRIDEAKTAWQTGAAGASLPGEQNEYREKCRQALAELEKN